MQTKMITSGLIVLLLADAALAGNVKGNQAAMEVSSKGNANQMPPAPSTSASEEQQLLRSSSEETAKTEKKGKKDDAPAAIVQEASGAVNARTEKSAQVHESKKDGIVGPVKKESELSARRDPKDDEKEDKEDEKGAAKEDEKTEQTSAPAKEATASAANDPVAHETSSRPLLVYILILLSAVLLSMAAYYFMVQKKPMPNITGPGSSDARSSNSVSGTSGTENLKSPFKSNDSFSQAMDSDSVSEDSSEKIAYLFNRVRNSLENLNAQSQSAAETQSGTAASAAQK